MHAVTQAVSVYTNSHYFLQTCLLCIIASFPRVTETCVNCCQSIYTPLFLMISWPTVSNACSGRVD